MKNARISELRDRLSEYLARVRKGETIIVYDRDTPIARIEPIPAYAPSVPEWVREAERRGIMTPPKKTGRFVLGPPIQIEPKFSILEALLEERRTGR